MLIYSTLNKDSGVETLVSRCFRSGPFSLLHEMGCGFPYFMLNGLRATCPFLETEVSSPIGWDEGGELSFSTNRVLFPSHVWVVGLLFRSGVSALFLPQRFHGGVYLVHLAERLFSGRF